MPFDLAGSLEKLGLPSIKKQPVYVTLLVNILPQNDLKVLPSQRNVLNRLSEALHARCSKSRIDKRTMNRRKRIQFWGQNKDDDSLILKIMEGKKNEAEMLRQCNAVLVEKKIKGWVINNSVQIDDTY